MKRVYFYRLQSFVTKNSNFINKQFSTNYQNSKHNFNKQIIQTVSTVYISFFVVLFFYRFTHVLNRFVFGKNFD